MQAKPYPGLGNALRDWRLQAQLSRRQLAAGLYADGYYDAGDAARIARLIRYIEDRDIWPLSLRAARPFCEGCRARMPVPPYTDHAFIYLLTLMLLQRRRLGPPHLSPALVPPPWPKP